MDQFNLEIISPEKSFLIKNDTEEVVIPGIEGYMGILKDHIPIISFLKPGIIDVKSKNEILNFYVGDGIVVVTVYFQMTLTLLDTWCCLSYGCRLKRRSRPARSPAQGKSLGTGRR